MSWAASEAVGRRTKLALRRLLQGAVQDLEPSDGALDHLRRAVPARRARKRQALVGAAAAALLIGTAVPAFVHVANSSGSDSANPVNAGHGEQAQGGTGSEAGADGGESGTDSPSAGGQGTGQDQGGAEQAPETGARQRRSARRRRRCANPPGTVAASSPACDAEPARRRRGAGGQPDADGKVYGTFRIANVSDDRLRGQRRRHGRLPGAWARPTPPRSAWSTTRRATRRPDCPTPRRRRARCC